MEWLEKSGSVHLLMIEVDPVWLTVCYSSFTNEFVYTITNTQL